MPSKFYAYLLENKEEGIVSSWKECETIVTGKKARYRGFKTEKEARQWLEEGAFYENDSVELEKGVYFDAGTGRGDGVEVSVTDETGKNLLPIIMDEQKLNSFGKHLLPGKTNNYGELMGCFLAIKIAMQTDADTVFGDSKLVMDYWSKGQVNEKVEEETRQLADAVKALRGEYEKAGGKLLRVSGDHNPADLGFHR